MPTRTRMQISRDMALYFQGLQQADIHSLLSRQRDLATEARAPKTGPLKQRMNGMAQLMVEAIRLEEQIVGWLVANVPEDMLMQAAMEAHSDVDDFPLA